MNPVDKATFAAALAEQMRRQLDPHHPFDHTTADQLLVEALRREGGYDDLLAAYEEVRYRGGYPPEEPPFGGPPPKPVGVD